MFSFYSNSDQALATPTSTQLLLQPTSAQIPLQFISQQVLLESNLSHVLLKPTSAQAALQSTLVQARMLPLVTWSVSVVDWIIGRFTQPCPWQCQSRCVVCVKYIYHMNKFPSHVALFLASCILSTITLPGKEWLFRGCTLSTEILNQWPWPFKKLTYVYVLPHNLPLYCLHSRCWSSRDTDYSFAWSLPHGVCIMICTFSEFGHDNNS